MGEFRRPTQAGSISVRIVWQGDPSAGGSSSDGRAGRYGVKSTVRVRRGIDIQAGCGRTGTFFSFEEMGIKPDMITLSKSLSGYGLPFAMVLLRKELDQWKPGEHNGTFRGHNPAFVTATAALKRYWRDRQLTAAVQAKGRRVREFLKSLAGEIADMHTDVRGLGLIQGLEFIDAPGGTFISPRMLRIEVTVSIRRATWASAASSRGNSSASG